MVVSLEETQRIFRYVPFDVRVSMGLVPGFEGLQKFGRNEAISAATPEDVWSVGGTYVFPTGAETLSLVSTSDEDQPSGDGAGVVEVIGLADDYAAQTELVELDGDQPVLTTKEFLRGHRGICRVPGSGSLLDRNLGVITATQSSSGIVVLSILAQFGQTLMAVYTVPLGRTLIMTRAYASVGKQIASALSAELIVRPFGECFQVKGIVDGNSQGSALAQATFKPGSRYAEKTDLKVTAGVSGNAVTVNAGFDGYLFQNNVFIQGD
jgi:hypothetical protein